MKNYSEMTLGELKVLTESVGITLTLMQKDGRYLAVAERMDPWWSVQIAGADLVTVIAGVCVQAEAMARSERGIGVQQACHACLVEAEFGTEDDPHPVPVNLHSCADRDWQP